MGARHNLGYALEYQGVIEDAIAAYEAVRQSPTPLAQSSFNLGVLLARSDRNDEARRLSNKPSNATPPTPGPGSIWACCTPGADGGGAPLLRTGAGSGSLLSQRSQSWPILLARESHWEEALGEYSRLVETGWRSGREVQYRRGLALAAQGDDEEAIQAYERALEAEPDHIFAQVQLALLYAQRERYDQATETLQRAADLAPDNARVHYNLGNMHARQAVEGGNCATMAMPMPPCGPTGAPSISTPAPQSLLQPGLRGGKDQRRRRASPPGKSISCDAQRASEQEWVMKARRYLHALKGD